MIVGDVLEEYKELPEDGADLEVLTLTERNGFVRQAERFSKRLATENTSKYKVVRRNDLAFNPYLLWAGAVAQNTICDAGVISPLYPTFRARPGADPKFMGYFLLTPQMVAKYDAIAFGSVPRRRRSSVSDFLALDLPDLPSLEDQRRIAGILDAADSLRAKRRQALAKLDTLTQSIFIDMFGDPVVNPRHWPTAPLADLGALDRGVSKHRPRNDPALLGGAWPLIQTGDVANSNGYISSHSSTYSDVGLAQSKIWPAGTLCITIAANIAKSGILTFDACFPDSVVGFTSDTLGRTEYVRSFMRFLQPVLERHAPESAQKNINLATLRTLQVPVPPQHEISRFSAAISKAVGIAGPVDRHGLGLDALFASLQQRAFRGEL